MISQYIQFEDITVLRSIGTGCKITRRDKSIILTELEWTTLFSLRDEIKTCFENGGTMQELLDPLQAKGQSAKFVIVETYNGYMYIKIRKWFWETDTYKPTREGVTLRLLQWEELVRQVSK